MKRIVAWMMLTVLLVICLAGCQNNQYSTDKIEPSEMTVTCGGVTIQPERGTTYWKHLIGKKEWYEIEIEKDLPNMRKEDLPCLEFSVSDEKNVVTMEFDIEPLDIFVLRWEEDAWGDIMAESDEVYVEGNTFEIENENGIYEIWARWYTSEGNQLQGSVYYSFYTKKV